MARITDEQVSAKLAEIVDAEHGFAAWKILSGVSRTMLARLADLTHAPESDGPWGKRRHVFTDAGWRDEDRAIAPDGYGPCESGFSSKSSRPWVCRHCNRHGDDHKARR